MPCSEVEMGTDTGSGRPVSTGTFWRLQRADTAAPPSVRGIMCRTCLWGVGASCPLGSRLMSAGLVRPAKILLAKGPRSPLERIHPEGRRSRAGQRKALCLVHLWAWASVRRAMTFCGEGELEGSLMETTGKHSCSPAASRTPGPLSTGRSQRAAPT